MWQFVRPLQQQFYEVENEVFISDYLSKVKTVIDCSHYYSCLMGMDKTHMYPEEIMSHISSLLKMESIDAFENLEITKKRLFALKLDKELPTKADNPNKITKI
ncbi:hypothetical protein [Methylotenera sp.]|uniref:hypothetical protein n=1 Tax=Methylotenera sp. TaxID=2051956 RepID=UPI002489B611|nr:hypothetical protein [Methylotenera sp.]MDI1298930.1 hypothetical protein [Methylotenera sp.]